MRRACSSGLVLAADAVHGGEVDLDDRVDVGVDPFGQDHVLRGEAADLVHGLDPVFRAYREDRVVDLALEAAPQIVAGRGRGSGGRDGGLGGCGGSGDGRGGGGGGGGVRVQAPVRVRVQPKEVPERRPRPGRSR